MPRAGLDAILSRMIHVCPLAHISSTVSAHGLRRVLSLVAVGTEIERPAGVAPSNHLTLYFHDIVEPLEGYTLPAADHVAEALDFAARDKGAILVHCYAGVSRSTAMAYAIACAREPDRDEAELAETLRRLSATATPNGLIVRLADEALGRDGRMVRAIEAIGRGADCYEGAPFALGPAR